MCWLPSGLQHPPCRARGRDGGSTSHEDREGGGDDDTKQRQPVCVQRTRRLETRKGARDNCFSKKPKKDKSRTRRCLTGGHQHAAASTSRRWWYTTTQHLLS
jgi:hypothetical protein